MYNIYEHATKYLHYLDYNLKMSVHTEYSAYTCTHAENGSYNVARFNVITGDVFANCGITAASDSCYDLFGRLSLSLFLSHSLTQTNRNYNHILLVLAFLVKAQVCLYVN